MYRTKPFAPDYRHHSKTDRWCEMCQRDLAATTERLWVAYELDNFTLIIHPDDIAQAWDEVRARRAPHHRDCCIVFCRIGPECAKKVGREWLFTDANIRDAAGAHEQLDFILH